MAKYIFDRVENYVMSKKIKIIVGICVIVAISIILILSIINRKQKEAGTTITNLSFTYLEEDLDDNWDEASVTSLIISDENNKINIKKEGTYYLTGTTTNGAVIIDAGSEDTIKLVLDNVNITCENSSPVYVKNAKKVIITLAENSVNNLTDGTEYVYDDATNEEPDGALFSKDDLTINGSGTLNIKANFKDGIKCNDSLIIVNANINIEAEDDGINSNDSLYINEANINITKSYEGIESSIIEISGGNINIVSSDDGINISGDDESINRTLTINDGEIYVNASGDGIDINGSGYINGGTIKVDGPTNSGNGALDYDREFVVSNATLIACGSMGMTQSISNNSNTYCLNITFRQTQSADAEIKIVDADGNAILTYAPSKQYQSAVIASPLLCEGKEYTIYVDDTEIDKVTIESIVTNVGSMGGMNNMMNNGGGKMPGGNFEMPDGEITRGDMHMPEDIQIPEGEMPSGDIQKPDIPEGKMERPNRNTQNI